MHPLPKVLTLTDKAEQRIRSVLKNNPDKIGLLIGIQKGGCAGMEYAVKLIDSLPENTDKIEINGLRLYVPRDSLLFLLGTEIDYEVTDLRTGFVFNNPNQVSSCGCGESVMLKPFSS